MTGFYMKCNTGHEWINKDARVLFSVDKILIIKMCIGEMCPFAMKCALPLPETTNALN